MGLTECHCKKCGKSFYLPSKAVENGRGQYCSRECSGHTYRRVEVVCDYCGKSFIKTRYFAARSKKHYCSPECRNKGAIKLIHIRKQYNCTCQTCGKIFTKTRAEINQGKGKYCTRECFHKTRQKQVPVTCGTCGKTFTLRAGRIRLTNYCSRECNAKGISERQKGDKSHTWKGGRINYRGPNWYQQRKLAYLRDGGECQYCHRKPKAGQRQFQVHHIKPFRECVDYLEANELSNLITLCQPCHRKAECGKIPVPKRLL